MPFHLNRAMDNGLPRQRRRRFGAQVRRSVRRIKVAMASACAYQTEYHLAYLYLKRRPFLSIRHSRTRARIGRPTPLVRKFAPWRRPCPNASSAARAAPARPRPPSRFRV
jgi:hypothetical protein